MADIELRNETDLEFTDISAEIERTYHFPIMHDPEPHHDKKKHIYITIYNPQWLAVSKSGGHRIINKKETCFYIPPTWYFLEWKVKEGAPHFVK